MPSEDLRDVARRLSQSSAAQYQEFEGHFRRAFQTMRKVSALPCNEIRNGFEDLAEVLAAIADEDAAKADLWAWRARRHVVLASHDCLLSLLTFELHFLKSLLTHPKIAAAPNFKTLRTRVRHCERQRKTIKRPPVEPRQDVNILEQDLSTIETINQTIEDALESCEDLLKPFGAVLGGPKTVRRMVLEFAKKWAGPSPA